MNKSILIIGVAGTGKSSVCDELDKLGYKAFGIEDIEGMFTMVDRDTGEKSKFYDNDDLDIVKKHDWKCDIDKLKELMSKQKGIVFYAGVASNMDDILSLFDMLFLLKASPETLTKRLNKKKSNKFGGIKEVQEWLFSWKDWWEESMVSNGAIVIDANQDLKKVVEDIINKVGVIK